MKRAILLVDHGSRAPEANRVLEELGALLGEREHGASVAIAHMELAAPSIEEALATLAGAGATEIVVYPHFLAPGRHSRRDIPALVARAALPFPDLQVRLAEPLGAHPGLIDLIVERIDGAEAIKNRR